MRLTDDEIDSLDTCACGHWACEHTIDGCATVIPEGLMAAGFRFAGLPEVGEADA